MNLFLAETGGVHIRSTRVVLQRNTEQVRRFFQIISWKSWENTLFLYFGRLCSKILILLIFWKYSAWNTKNQL